MKLASSGALVVGSIALMALIFGPLSGARIKTRRMALSQGEEVISSPSLAIIKKETPKSSQDFSEETLQRTRAPVTLFSSSSSKSPKRNREEVAPESGTTGPPAPLSTQSELLIPGSTVEETPSSSYFPSSSSSYPLWDTAQQKQVFKKLRKVLPSFRWLTAGHSHITYQPQHLCSFVDEEFYKNPGVEDNSDLSRGQDQQKIICGKTKGKSRFIPPPLVPLLPYRRDRWGKIPTFGSSGGRKKDSDGLYERLSFDPYLTWLYSKPEEYDVVLVGVGSWDLRWWNRTPQDMYTKYYKIFLETLYRMARRSSGGVPSSSGGSGKRRGRGAPPSLRLNPTTLFVLQPMHTVNYSIGFTRACYPIDRIVATNAALETALHDAVEAISNDEQEGVASSTTSSSSFSMASVGYNSTQQQTASSIDDLSLREKTQQEEKRTVLVAVFDVFALTKSWPKPDGHHLVTPGDVVTVSLQFLEAVSTVLWSPSTTTTTTADDSEGASPSSLDHSSSSHHYIGTKMGDFNRALLRRPRRMRGQFEDFKDTLNSGLCSHHDPTSEGYFHPAFMFKPVGIHCAHFGTYENFTMAAADFYERKEAPKNPVVRSQVLHYLKNRIPADAQECFNNVGLEYESTGWWDPQVGPLVNMTRFGQRVRKKKYGALVCLCAESGQQLVSDELQTKAVQEAGLSEDEISSFCTNQMNEVRKGRSGVRYVVTECDEPGKRK